MSSQNNDNDKDNDKDVDACSMSIHDDDDNDVCRCIISGCFDMDCVLNAYYPTWKCGASTKCHYTDDKLCTDVPGCPTKETNSGVCSLCRLVGVDGKLNDKELENYCLKCYAKKFLNGFDDYVKCECTDCEDCCSHNITCDGYECCFPGEDSPPSIYVTEHTGERDDWDNNLCKICNTGDCVDRMPWKWQLHLKCISGTQLPIE